MPRSRRRWSPPPLEVCPHCGLAFVACLRGQVHRLQRWWEAGWLSEKTAVICQNCKTLVDWEMPPTLPLEEHVAP